MEDSVSTKCTCQIQAKAHTQAQKTSDCKSNILCAEDAGKIGR